MKKLLFIRHGQTAGNLEKRYVGRTDELLCDPGKSKVAEKKKILLSRFSEIERKQEFLAVSPMKRCIETATILFPEKKPLIIDDFREMDFGEFEYKNYIELQNNVDYQRFIDSNGRTDFPNAEKRLDFMNRCCKAFEVCCCEHMRENDDGMWIFVVHGGTIMSILERYASPHKEFYEWQVKPAEAVYCELDCNEEDKAMHIRVKEII